MMRTGIVITSLCCIELVQGGELTSLRNYTNYKITLLHKLHLLHYYIAYIYYIVKNVIFFLHSGFLFCILLVHGTNVPSITLKSGGFKMITRTELQRADRLMNEKGFSRTEKKRWINQVLIAMRRKVC
jgi:hypothetical protein